MGVCEAQDQIGSISRRGEAKEAELILKLQLDSGNEIRPRGGAKPRDCKLEDSRTRTRTWTRGQGPASGLGGGGRQNSTSGARVRGRAKAVKDDAMESALDSGAPLGRSKTRPGEQKPKSTEAAHKER